MYLEDPGAQPIVVAVLPRAGLGNLLLVWARALVYAHLNGLQFHASGWHHVRLGPWLRRERAKRYYGSSVQLESSVLAHFMLKARFDATSRNRKLFNPAVEKVGREDLAGVRWVVFDQIPHWSDYFKDLKPHRQFVNEQIRSLVRPRIHEELARLPSPTIGVHARLGDFRPLKEGEDFAKVGSVRTPQTYFMDVIRAIRTVKGPMASATVFSNGRPDELAELLSQPATELAPPREDFVDMLLLARSEVIVTSAGSSFSCWSGFLSDAPIIMHPDHLVGSIRLPDEGLYEGPIAEPLDPLLASQLRMPRAPQQAVLTASLDVSGSAAR